MGEIPSFSELIQAGMYDYSLRATEIDPPFDGRGPQASQKAVSWSCTITSFSAARPLIRAIRNNPEEADNDARLRFMAVFAGKTNPTRKPLDPISEDPNRKKTVRKSPELNDLSEEAASLI